MILGYATQALRHKIDTIHKQGQEQINYYCNSSIVGSPLRRPEAARPSVGPAAGLRCLPRAKAPRTRGSSSPFSLRPDSARFLQPGKILPSPTAPTFRTPTPLPSNPSLPLEYSTTLVRSSGFFSLIVRNGSHHGRDRRRSQEHHPQARGAR